MATAALIISVIAALAAVALVVVAQRARGDAKRSADEARKARLDAGGPRLAMRPVRGLSTRWLLPSQPNRVPLPYNPPRALAWPQDKAHSLYLGASFVIRNEGHGTADLVVTGWPLFDAQFDQETGYVVTPDEQVQRQWRDGNYQLAPDTETTVVLRDGPTLDQLREQGSGQWTATFTVRATDALRSVVDTWTVTASTFLAGQSEQLAGEWRLGAWLETSVTMSGPVRTYT